MKRPSIKTSFTIVFGLLGLLSIGTAIISLSALGSLNANTATIGNVSFPKIVHAMELRESFDNLELILARQLVASNMEEIKAENDNQIKVEARLDAAITESEVDVD